MAVNLGISEMCQCGCRGWCTMFPVLLALSWDLAALATGSERRLDQYGHALETIIGAATFIIVVLEIRADWPAWAELSGIRIWAHAIFPCPKCDMRKAAISNTVYVGFVKTTSTPWNSYRHQDYLNDIKRHSIEP